MHWHSHHVDAFADPNYQGLPWLRGGMGDLGSAASQQINAIVTTGASSTVGILVALGTIGGPIGAAAAGLIAVSSLIVNLFQGCGQTCVVATGDANQVGDALKQNLQTYLASPVHTQSLQAAALNNFNTTWAALVAACSNPSLGAAGQRCISDRAQGSCAYKTTPGGWAQDATGKWAYTYPGANGSGDTCWNYWVGFHDPIANDPTAVPDSAVTSTSASSSATPGTTTTATTTDSSSNAVSGLFDFANWTPETWVLIAAAAGLLLLGGD